MSSKPDSVASSAGVAAVAAAEPHAAPTAHRIDLSADEYFDLLDAEGKPMGQTKLRKLVHRDGDWHACVHIWLLHSRTGEVLLQQRAAHKDSFPSCWDVSCAGHLSAGESVTAACAAELAEELGLTAPPGVAFTDWCRPLAVLPREVISQQGRFIDREYTHCFIIEGEYDADSMQLQAEEVAGVKWMPLAEVRAALKAAAPGFVTYPDFDAYDAAVFAQIEKRRKELQAAQQQQSQ